MLAITRDKSSIKKRESKKKELNYAMLYYMHLKFKKVDVSPN
jgi:hypothetical protein